MVFFCGAGISRSAKLPDFACLAQQLVNQFSDANDPLPQSEIDKERFDSAIHLLEKNQRFGRKKVRDILPDILKPKLNCPDATATHNSLLKLSKTREQPKKKSRMRLVTTNFDRLFETVMNDDSSMLSKTFQAPLLPVPKEGWDGLVYLHGLLMQEPTEDDLDSLVLSSGDFGRAYLTERWAARFVSELFRRYIICFVGYSLNDPVIRYMTDALAADSLLGEPTREMFAFADHKIDEREQTADKWNAKNVTPILYYADPKHTLLHETLKEWAKIYDEKEQGKVNIVKKYVHYDPINNTPESYFVGLMLWVLRDPSGKPSECFAQSNPAHSLAWLKPMAENRRFKESLTNVTDTRVQERTANEMQKPLISWLTSHFNDPRLLEWLANDGSELREKFSWFFRRHLYKLIDGETNDSRDEGGFNPFMRELWERLIERSIRREGRSRSFQIWCNEFRLDGLTKFSLQELRKLLNPRILLRDFDKLARGQVPEDEGVLIYWEVALAGGNTDSLMELNNEEQWISALPTLLPEFTDSLRNAFNLIQKTESANQESGLVYIRQTSINEHSRDDNIHDWMTLIDPIRNAWLALERQSTYKATAEAISWWTEPCPLFQRLALFAAAQGDAIPASIALDWLLEEEGKWLWASESEPEVLELLRVLPKRLNPDEFKRLEEAIIAGPANHDSEFEE